MTRITGHQVGIELYHLIKSGANFEMVPEEDLPSGGRPVVQAHTETNRLIRSYPDGTIDIAERVITDEIAY
jgi:hypothetical protein